MPNPALSGLLDLDAEPVREFFRHAPVMMHAISEDGRIISVSRYWAARLGYTPEEMIGRRSIDLLTPASRKLALEEILPRFFREGELHRQPYEFVRKDGVVLPMLLSAITLQNPAGGSGRGLAFITDNDDRDLLQRDLHFALLNAERANQAKAQFLTAMSHELRTPMNAILGFAQLLRLTELSAKQSAHVEAILASGDQLMSRLSELLELSQLEFSKIQQTKAPVAPEVLLAPLVTRWKPEVEAKKLVFLQHIDAGVPSQLLIDAARVQQILTHFLSNALLNTERGGISLGVRLLQKTGANDRLELFVTDNGAGIDPAKVDELFEPFSDKKSDFAKSGGGWSVGLSFCRTLADAMGADIGVRPNPDGEGSVFYLILDLETVR